MVTRDMAMVMVTRDMAMDMITRDAMIMVIRAMDMVIHTTINNSSQSMIKS